MAMIGQTFYKGYEHNIVTSYADVKDPSWPNITSADEFLCLPQRIQDECNVQHNFTDYQKFYSSYDKIYKYIEQQGNRLVHCPDLYSPGAYITRVGKDLYQTEHPDCGRG